MPGILPMKVIKIGSSTQSRVAQACDRCRSKKIRCDGVTPSCSQCANVGFECKTSDKLSRRAFPRGYTESLEERVRSLESEVRELKDLLDTKDEKIDILSRIQSSSPLPKRASSKSSNSDSNTSQTQDLEHRSQNDNASMQDVANTENPEFSISCSASASSGKSFVDAFRNELRANFPQAPNFKTQVFFNSWESCAHNDQASEFSAAVPSRMASDQMMNIFLQEWLPLFPVMHRSNVLQLYSSYVADPEKIQSRHEAAQLYLIFGISTLSAQWNNHGHRLFEQRWQSALDLAVKQVSVASLQGVLLAMLYCIAKQDHEKLRRYKNMSAKLTRRLGLHQSQKRSSLGPLATEMRKRLFWTSFTLDCFSSAILGQSRAFCDIDIACEFPLDVDDENITEESFLTGTPGEYTRISSALALFRGARIMADVLDTVYSSTPPHEVSSLAIASLRDQLDSWYGDLAPHLCLKFLQEKPSSAVVGNRAPFLALMHDYIKTLLYRPLVLADNQSRPPAALISLAQSSKHIIQIIQLLEERRLSFSFGINKGHLLTMAGFGLLYPFLGMDRMGSFAQDNQRCLRIVCTSLNRDQVAGHLDFQDLVNAVALPPLALDQADFRSSKGWSNGPTSSLHKKRLNIVQKQQSLRPSHGRSSSANIVRVKREPMDEATSTRRSATSSLLPEDAGMLTGDNVHNFAYHAALNSHRPYSFPVSSNQASPDAVSLPNLDYLDFSCESPPSFQQNDANGGMDCSVDSVNLLPQNNNTMPALGVFPSVTGSGSSDSFAWSSGSWTPPSTFDRPNPSSVLSFSDESLTSAEDLSTLLPAEFLTATV